MGIEGLLNLLNPITIKQHISTFQGQTAAIDIMSWVYKGCYRCAYDHNLNIESNSFLYYILEMLELLAYYRIKPICVFDGRYISKKDETVEKRRKAKQQNRQKGLQFLSQGKQELARKYLSRCIIIDDRIISLVICALYTKGIEYMIAPYQSDSQVSKLVHLGLADFAITEDSDLIVYNTRVVLKLSQDGECDFIDVKKWTKESVDQLCLKQYLDMDFINRIQCAILAGSDYNNSIKGIGIKKAIKNLTQRKTINAVIEHLRQKKPFCENIPENYQSIVLESKLIFIFATIYNPLSQQLQFFNPDLLEKVKPQTLSIEQLKSIVGPFYDYNESIKLGKINIRTSQPRIIDKIDIKSVFSINYGNLTIRESANQKRRQLQKQQKQRREQELRRMAQNGQAPVITEKKHSKKQPAVIVQLSQEQKKKLFQQRKADKIRRFSQFKEMLNNLVMEYSSQSESSEESSQDQVRVQKTSSNKKTNKTNQNIEEKNDQSNEENEFVNEQNSQSVSFDLQSLNPWAKHQ